MLLNDIIDELKAIKECSSIKANVIRELYQRLYEKHCIISMDKERTR